MTEREIRNMNLIEILIEEAEEEGVEISRPPENAVKWYAVLCDGLLSLVELFDYRSKPPKRFNNSLFHRLWIRFKPSCCCILILLQLHWVHFFFDLAFNTFNNNLSDTKTPPPKRYYFPEVLLAI